MRTGVRAPAPIKKVEQVSGFYDSSVENELAFKIERPANLVVDKLIGQHSINGLERHCLAKYIGVMIKRVPFQRHKGRQLGKKVAADYLDEIRLELAKMVATGDRTEEFAAKRKAQVEEIFAKQEGHWIESLVRTPWTTGEVIASIETMEWAVLRAEGPSFFLTSDNPVCWDRSVGLGTDTSEFLFPLSTSIILHGSARARRSKGIRFGLVPQNFVRQCNLATVKNAFNAVFYNADEQWVRRVLSKWRATPAGS